MLKYEIRTTYHYGSLDRLKFESFSFFHIWVGWREKTECFHSRSVISLSAFGFFSTSFLPLRLICAVLLLLLYRMFFFPSSSLSLSFLIWATFLNNFDWTDHNLVKPVRCCESFAFTHSHSFLSRSISMRFLRWNCESQQVTHTQRHTFKTDREHRKKNVWQTIK